MSACLYECPTASNGLKCERRSELASTRWQDELKYGSQIRELAEVREPSEQALPPYSKLNIASAHILSLLAIGRTIPFGVRKGRGLVWNVLGDDCQVTTSDFAFVVVRDAAEQVAFAHFDRLGGFSKLEFRSAGSTVTPRQPAPAVRRDLAVRPDCRLAHGIEQARRALL